MSASWLNYVKAFLELRPRRRATVTALQRLYQYLYLRYTYSTKHYGYGFESWVLYITCVVTCIVTYVVCFLQQLAYVLDHFIYEFIK